MATPKNRSVQKAFLLLRCFRSPHEWVTNAELSRRSGLSEAGSHRLMRTLEDIGVVLRNRQGCYRTGLVLCALSEGISVGELIGELSQDDLVQLAARLGGVVHIGVLQSGMVCYTAKFGAHDQVAIPSRVGTQQEAYCSALGKSLLAGMTAEQFDDFLHDGELVALTPKTITHTGDFRSEIAAVRQRGYAVDKMEVFQDICCVGAPIRDPRGNTIAALSFADSARNLCRSWEEDVAGHLMAAAGAIGRRMFPLQGKTAH
jgi:DNA-binding IclR family transcriptional regulator